MSSVPLTARRSIEIEFGDCDPAGIVYFPNFFRFFDNATAHLLSTALGMNKRAWIRTHGILGIPAVDVSATFRAPSRFGDRVDIESTVVAVGGSSFRVAHRLTNAGVLAVEGTETRVWIAADPADPERLEPVRIPDDVRRALGHGGGDE